jgi:mannosyltransferase
MKKYLFLIIALGLVLRLYNLTSISLWHDEAFSALLIRYPWSEMLYRIGLDVHPPMYYIFLRAWHWIFGWSLESLRGFSVFFGVAVIPLTYAFVRQAFKKEAWALLAALLVAMNPFQIQYVTEARMYTMGAFFALLAAHCLVRALDAERQHRSGATGSKDFLAYYLGFAVSTAIMIQTHYYLFFTAGALGVYGLLEHFHWYRFKFQRYLYFLAACCLVLVSFLPWLKTFLYQLQQVQGGYWIPPIDRWSIPSTLSQMLLGVQRYGDFLSLEVLAVLVTVFTLVFLYRFLRRTDRPEKWLLLFNIVAPFAGALLFYGFARLRGQESSVFLVRYFLFASIFYTIALAIWIKQLNHQRLAKTLLIVYVLLNFSAFIGYWYYLDVKTKPGMAAAAKFLNANVEPGHKIYIGSSFEFFNYKYYNNTSVRPLLYSGGNTDIKNLPHFAGTAILTNEDLLPDFRVATKRGDMVWLLWTNGFGGNKPQTPNNWVQIDEKEYPEVRPYVGTNIYVTEYKVN